MKPGSNKPKPKSRIRSPAKVYDGKKLEKKIINML